jgi:hypothetical protein
MLSRSSLLSSVLSSYQLSIILYIFLYICINLLSIWYQSQLLATLLINFAYQTTLKLLFCTHHSIKLLCYHHNSSTVPHRPYTVNLCSCTIHHVISHTIPLPISTSVCCLYTSIQDRAIIFHNQPNINIIK